MATMEAYTANNTLKPEASMKKTRLLKAFSLAAMALACCVALAACGGQAATSNGGSTPASANQQVIIGTMATEDILPMWVAEQEGLFTEAGVNATVQVFQSAQELSTALASGAVNMAMTDAQVSATLQAGGVNMVMEWVTLGSTASQGRFGIMTSPASGITSLEQLAGVPIGVGSNTVPEYVMDKLMERAGVATDQVVSEEIKKLPVRYEMMTSNQVAAAALPASMLALGEATGMVLLADDTTGENISQSVMAARADWAQSNAETIKKLKDVWNAAVKEINEDPEKYRALLVEKASLPEAVAQTYPISTYPEAEYPTNAMIDPVLDWMLEKGYLTSALTYDQTTGAFQKA
ncbi:MAG: ABC transporter substrate-binding protein [Coriobacteriia bacterium]|nr:ABC transporter substrate-binding protein [Coriobacteriia bacterium]